MVGTYCTAMYPFLHHGEQKIFITGIRPTIITSWHQKLFYSAVNLKVLIRLLLEVCAPLLTKVIYIIERLCTNINE